MKKSKKNHLKVIDIEAYLQNRKKELAEKEKLRWKNSSLTLFALVGAMCLPAIAGVYDSYINNEPENNKPSVITRHAEIKSYPIAGIK